MEGVAAKGGRGSLIYAWSGCLSEIFPPLSADPSRLPGARVDHARRRSTQLAMLGLWPARGSAPFGRASRGV